jgi:cytochrome c553
VKVLRPWIISACIGAAALLMLPLSGLLPHTARKEAVGEWYHQMATRQSVTLRSLTTLPPDLADPAMAARAAGHYEMVCAACHGSPAAAPLRIAQDMSPAPPPFIAGHWRSAPHQFLVVRDGIAQSAMPSWPSPDRADEVWDMVAFLRQMPDLSAEDYRRMAGQGLCIDCHGPQGQGRDGIPRLDIQTPTYIATALRAFRDGTRQSGAMMAAARGLSDDEIVELAAEFGRGVVLPMREGEGAALLATLGRAEMDIPACLSCHGPQARDDYPRLIGQDGRYLRRQLELFQTLGVERGGPHAATMAPISAQLSQEDIDDLTEWLGRDPE